MDHVAAATEIAERFQAAWNAHDMTAFAALFHPEATFVNRFGAYWRGVAPIVDGHRVIHETIYRDSVLGCRMLDADSIADGVAAVHIRARLTAGAAHPAGRHAIDTLILAVIVERDGVWRIQAAENATLCDPATGAPTLAD